MVAEMIAVIGRDDHYGIVPVATLFESPSMIPICASMLEMHA